ncbi:MAG: sugar ABC transporter permease, partial [Chloroflexi bacterium]|nr:sugar ABC transporter permease [Chloroflexota bacterium]
MNRSFAKWKSGLALTLPSFLFVFAFLVYPIVYLITLSFKEYSPLRSTEQRFIGLENYTWVLGSDNVIHSFKVTLGFTVLSVFIEMAVG